MSGREHKLIHAMREAVEVAGGRKVSARLYWRGHNYVPETPLTKASPDLYDALIDAEAFIASMSGNGETAFRAKLNAVLARARGYS